MKTAASLNYSENMKLHNSLKNDSFKFKNNNNPDKKRKFVFSQNIELIYSELCLLFLLGGFIAEKNLQMEAAFLLYMSSYFFGGYFAAKEAFFNIIKGKFEIDFLMIFAAAGSAVLGKFSEGALLLFLFSLGHALEHYALERAKKQIKALSDLTPQTADVKRNGKTITVPVESLKTGETVIVKPGSKIPADGFVLSGESSVNQAPITGESVPVFKTPLRKDPKSVAFNLTEEQHKVFAGTINGEGLIEISVARISSDSTLAKLIQMVNEAESKQSPAQQFTKNIEKYYVPAILIFIVILCFAFLILNETPLASFYRAMRVLVGGSPCALAISTPSAVLSGIARAAKERVLIKGGKALEELGSLDFIAFDKTGTLTEGLPTVQEVYTYEIEENELFNILYSVENLSTHPVAKAVVNRCEAFYRSRAHSLTEAEHMMEEVLKKYKVSESRNISGKGVSAIIGGQKIYIGSQLLIEKSGFSISDNIRNKIDKLHDSGCTTMIIALEGRGISGIVSVADEIRPEASNVIKALKASGITEIIMLSGDNQKVADKVGNKLGLTISKGNLLPEDKLNIIKKMKQTGFKIAMVGDGVNDAPAMATSNVGIAMGAAGSDVALETADIALLADRLDKLPFVVELSRKAQKIVRQNLFISLGMIVFLIPASLFNITEMGATVMLHEGSTIIVAFNALRLLIFRNKY